MKQQDKEGSRSTVPVEPTNCQIVLTENVRLPLPSGITSADWRRLDAVASEFLRD